MMIKYEFRYWSHPSFTNEYILKGKIGMSKDYRVNWFFGEIYNKFMTDFRFL